MKETIKILERDFCKDDLYWRHLEDFDSQKEGAFLAGTFWVSQYHIMTGGLQKAKQIIDAALKYSNDLGLFAEEADPVNKIMLGNMPQSFVHAAFIGTVIDYKNALEENK